MHARAKFDPLLLALPLFIIGPSLAAQTVGDSLPRIDAFGEAEFYVAPDQAVIFFDIEGNGMTVEEAAASLAEKVAHFKEVVGSISGDVGPMIPWGYKAAPNDQQPRVYGTGAPVQTNRDHLAVEGFQIEVRDLSDLPDVLETLSQGEVRQILAMQYGHSNLAEILDEVTATASQRAESRAAAMAASLGGELGNLLRIGPSRTYDPRSQALMQILGPRGVQLSLPAQEIGVRVRVDGSWLLIR